MSKRMACQGRSIAMCWRRAQRSQIWSRLSRFFALTIWRGVASSYCQSSVEAKTKRRTGEPGREVCRDVT
eukprot:4636359-Pleurochrysis_carterae.AAC.1